MEYHSEFWKKISFFLLNGYIWRKKVSEKSRECHKTTALPRHKEEEETYKTKQVQIEQTYEKHYG